MANRPNLLYVFADQLRRTSCGYTGYKNAITPNIDAFHDCSMDFTQAVSGHPVCAPYRATLFTGKYTSSTGVVINEIRFNPNQRCIGHVLTEGGYETAYIGKWHLYADEWGNHFDPKNSFVPKGPDRLGFDDYWGGLTASITSISRRTHIIMRTVPRRFTRTSTSRMRRWIWRFAI